MGTRGDFYVGRGPNMRWLGSVAYDAHHGNYEFLLAATRARKNRAKKYRQLVNDHLRETDHATFPKDGWPWPWSDSCLTDVSYTYDNGIVYATEFWLDEEYNEKRENHPCVNCEYGRKAWVNLAVLLKEERRHSRLWSALRNLKQEHDETPERYHKKREELLQKIAAAQAKYEAAGGDETSERAPRLGEAVFPNMRSIQNVTLGRRSGVMIFSVG